ncbi:MAG: TIGR01212 family radical SAM protein [Clostridia bacterium]|nr:TIGR01212 family radical SAM protein [Clostridia bacterium]
MYKTLNEHYKEKYGCKVYKLSIDGGFTCPNRDGKIDTRGCIFCSAAGGGDFAEKRCGSIEAQLERAKQRVETKINNGKYIAYFQSFTNTYAPTERLKELYSEAIKPDYIVGLSIGTRPDCIGDDVIELLREVNSIKPVTIELGLQTSNEKTAEYIRRSYKNEVYADAVKRLKAAGIEVVTHIIIGLPNETKEDSVSTTKYAVANGSDGVKFHLLHVLRGTDLEKNYLNGEFSCLSLGEYGSILKECISVLPEGTVVHRITGDGAKRDLIAPLWSADKKRVLNFLNNLLRH